MFPGLAGAFEPWPGGWQGIDGLVAYDSAGGFEWKWNAALKKLCTCYD